MLGLLRSFYPAIIIFASISISISISTSQEVYAKGGDAPSDAKLQAFDEKIVPVDVHDCKVFVRSIASFTKGKKKRPKVIAINGIPVSAWIYRDFAIRLSKKGWNLDLVDLPGTGQSFLEAPTKWPRQRSCIKAYLLEQKEPFILVLHDIAGPIVLPLIHTFKNMKGLFVMNSLLKTHGFKPIAPMSTLKMHLFGDFATVFMGRSKFHREMKKVGLAKEVDRVWLDQLFNDVKKGGSIQRLSSIMRSFDNSKIIDTLIAENIQNFKGRKLAVWGVSDPSLGGLSYYAKGVFGEDQYLSIDTAKHFLMMDFSTELADMFHQKFSQ